MELIQSIFNRTKRDPTCTCRGHAPHKQGKGSASNQNKENNSKSKWPSENIVIGLECGVPWGVRRACCIQNHNSNNHTFLYIHHSTQTPHASPYYMQHVHRSLLSLSFRASQPVTLILPDRIRVSGVNKSCNIRPSKTAD